MDDDPPGTEGIRISSYDLSVRPRTGAPRVPDSIGSGIEARRRRMTGPSIREGTRPPTTFTTVPMRFDSPSVSTPFGNRRCRSPTRTSGGEPAFRGTGFPGTNGPRNVGAETDGRSRTNDGRFPSTSQRRNRTPDPSSNDGRPGEEHYPIENRIPTESACCSRREWSQSRWSRFETAVYIICYSGTNSTEIGLNYEMQLPHRR